MISKLKPQNGYMNKIVQNNQRYYIAAFKNYMN